MKAVKSSLLAVMCMCLAISVFAQQPKTEVGAFHAGEADYNRIYELGKEFKEDKMAEYVPYNYEFFTSHALLTNYIKGVNKAKAAKNDKGPANKIKLFVFNKLVSTQSDAMRQTRLSLLSIPANWEVLLPKGEVVVTQETKNNTQKFAEVCENAYKDNSVAENQLKNFVSNAQSYGLIEYNEESLLSKIGRCWENGLKACGGQIRLR